MTEGTRLPLVERKRLAARKRVVRAAEELFAERGFDAVSVADIADRAEVGRTTFFRHFGDKSEVVFAQQHELVATIAAAHEQAIAAVPSSEADAIAQLRDIVVSLCTQVTEDPDAYIRHYAFIAQNAELRARDAVKMQDLADLLAKILIRRGTDEHIASFASQIALACFQTAKARRGKDPRFLVADTREAFQQVLALGTLGSWRHP